MKTTYVVGHPGQRGPAGEVLGWVRADVLADGSQPTDKVFFRDGTACGQADALERLALDPSLLYSTESQAVQEGLARLRDAGVAEDLPSSQLDERPEGRPHSAGPDVGRTIDVGEMRLAAPTEDLGDRRCE